MMDHDIYDFYLRVPFEDDQSRDLMPSLNPSQSINNPLDDCSQRRVQAFRWRWENPLELNERGPYIPECDKTTGKFQLKQCEPHSSESEVYNMDKIPCFCVREDGSVIQESRTSAIDGHRLR